MVDRKKYMKEVYSKYWINAREKKYGFLDYDKNVHCLLVNLAGDVRGKRLLEVAIGTGYPFAFSFDREGAEVYGIDISPDLVAKCKELYPNIRSEVGDAEELPFQDWSFDMAYCFHSSWYFPNLKKAIEEMIRTTKDGSFIAFDIQNKNNPDIENIYKRHLGEAVGIGKLKRIVKNVIKIAVRKGTPSWQFIVHQTPTYPEAVYKVLRENVRVSSYNLYGPTDSDGLKLLPYSSSFPEYERLVFVAHIG